jgi:hypothetical protein
MLGVYGRGLIIAATKARPEPDRAPIRGKIIMKV